MKRIILYFGVALIFIFNTASFCSRDEIQYSNVDVSPIVSGMSQGTWRITEYLDHGIDKTANFTGVDFTFGSNNLLTANSGGTIVNGTWIVTNNNHTDESPNDPVDFNISFESPPTYADITDDWDIVSRTATKLVLVDGTGQSIDNMTLEKN